MKRIYQILAFCAIGLASCDENEVPFYAAESDGIYFNYDASNEFEASVNFGEYMVGDSAYLSVPIKLKTLGYLANIDRRVILKGEAVDSYELADIEIPEIIMPAGETEIKIIVKVLRPLETDKQYAVQLSIDSESNENQIGLGVEEKSIFTIYSQETYEEPAAWVNMQYYFGNWTKEKFIFLAKVTGNDQYYNQSSDGERINVAAVDSIRTYYAANPDVEKTIDIPLISLSGWNGNYDCPSYWGTLHEKYLGAYNAGVFGNYCAAYNITTSNEAEEFAPTEENMQRVNKRAVTAMTNYLNRQFQSGSSLSYTASGFRIPIFLELFDDYEFAAPYWWANYPSTTPAGQVPTAIFMGDYYGEYSASKYRFMIKTLLEARGDNFSLVEMFPVCDDFMGGLTWDYMLWPEEAQQQIQNCHDLFLSKYNEAPDSYDFTFPTVIQFPSDEGSDKK